VHLNVRLEEDRLSLLVVIGVQVDGTKRLVALDCKHYDPYTSRFEDACGAACDWFTTHLSP